MLRKQQEYEILKQNDFFEFDDLQIPVQSFRTQYFNHPLEQQNRKSSDETKERLRTNRWSHFYLHLQYLNLQDGYITLCDIYRHILNLVVGIPQIESITSTHPVQEELDHVLDTLETSKNTLKRVNYFSDLLFQIKDKLAFLPPVQVNSRDIFEELNNPSNEVIRPNQFNPMPIKKELLKELSIQEILLQKVEFFIKTKKRSNQQVQFSKLQLILDSFEEYLSLTYQNYENLYTLKYHFKAYIIINYFKSRILSQQYEESLNAVAECIDFLKRFSLYDYQGYFQTVLNKINQSKDLKPFSIVRNKYVEQQGILRDSYYWRSKYYFKLAVSLSFQIFLDNLRYGRFGYQVFWSSDQFVICGNASYKTISFMFCEMKGICFSFGQGCLESAFKCSGGGGDCLGVLLGMLLGCFLWIVFEIVKIMAIYLIYGILYIFFFLRFICILYMIFQIILLISFVVGCFFCMVIWVMFNIMILDYYSPLDRTLNFPRILPIFQILFLYPFLAILKFAIVFCKFVYRIIGGICIKLFFVLVSIKHWLVFLVWIKFQGKIPEKESKDWTIKNTQKQVQKRYNILNLKRLCYIEFDNIKILIDEELKLIKVKSLEKKINNRVARMVRTKNEFANELEKYFTFPSEQNQILAQVNNKQTKFMKEIQDIFSTLRIKNQDIIEQEPGNYLYYDQQELQYLKYQIIKYLQELSQQRRIDLDSIGQSLGIKMSIYENLTNYLLKEIFEPYLYDTVDKNQSTEEKLTSLSRKSLVHVRDEQNQKILFKVNELVVKDIKDIQLMSELFQEDEININKQLMDFQKWIKPNTII